VNGCIAKRIDFEHQLFRAARLNEQQLALGHERLQQLKLGVVQLEDFGVHPAVPLLLGLAATVAHGQQTARLVKYHANDIVSVLELASLRWQPHQPSRRVSPT
jgi:hypothetical protein